MAKSHDRVLVTGAAGYVGSHVIKALLQEGYAVRGSVRDPNDPAKTAHLRVLGDVELVAADLMKPGSFDDAVKGCDMVVHAASAVLLTAKHPQREIIDVAVQGTQNVLSAIDKAGSVRRMVQTSSVSAVVSPSQPESHIFTEDDWADEATVDTDPYAVSKREAERLARAHCDARSEGDRYVLSAINPVFVQGPVLAKAHLRSSPGLARDLIAGKFPLAPALSFGIVDVRDVAMAHVRALEVDSPAPRYVCCAESLWLKELVEALRPGFSQYGLPKGHMPGFLMYGVALFDKRISFDYLRRNLNKQQRFDGSRLSTELGIEYRSGAQSIVDTAQSIVDLGFAPKK
jgi:dihydroflavonol-4-reductase